jgi:hypothetical protein
MTVTRGAKHTGEDSNFIKTIRALSGSRKMDGLWQDASPYTSVSGISPSWTAACRKLPDQLVMLADFYTKPLQGA